MDDQPKEVRPRETRPWRTRPLPLTPPTRGRVIFIVLGLLLLALISWAVLRSHTQTAGNHRTAQLAPVVAVPAQRGDMPVTLNALGTVTSLATVTVATQINGQLTEVGFKEGQEVNKGDFLAQIDPRPYQAALDQLQGQLLKDQALLRGAQVDLARYQKLAAQKSIAQQQADDQLYLVHQYEGTVRADQAMVDNAKLNLDYCHIVAPVSGRIGLRLVDPGNYVQTNSATGIAVLTQMKPISVIFSLPEDNLPAILKRLSVGAKLQVTAFDRSGKQKLATGTLETLDNQIDTSTGTVRFRATFANDDEMLFPNQFVNVQLLLDTLTGTTVIPSAAIQRGAPGTFVYVVQPDDTVAVRKVTLGPSDADNVAVTQGLEPSDRVVVDGADKLREGAKVSIAEAKAPAGGTPQASQPQQETQSRQGPQTQADPPDQQGQHSRNRP